MSTLNIAAATAETGIIIFLAGFGFSISAMGADNPRLWSQIGFSLLLVSAAFGIAAAWLAAAS